MTDVSHVARLIRDVMAEYEAREGTPLRQSDIVRRSGGRIKNSRLGQLLNDPIKRLPAPETIEALAAGLRVSEQRVMRAYLLDVAASPAGRREVPEQVQRAIDNVEAGSFDARTKAILIRAILDDWESQSPIPDDKRHAGGVGA